MVTRKVTHLFWIFLWIIIIELFMLYAEYTLMTLEH